MAAGLWLGVAPLGAAGNHPDAAPTPDTPLAAAAARAGIDQPTPPPTPVPTPLPAAANNASPQAPARSEVFAIRDPFAISAYTPDERRVRAMVNQLILSVTDRESVSAGWSSLVKPQDIVGIKIAAGGGPSGATHRAVVEAIIDGLRQAGVPAANIIVWDRDTEELRAAGYLDREGRSTLPCLVTGIAPRAYDPKDIYTAPVLGRLIWGDLLFTGQLVPADDLHTDAGQFTADPLRGGGRSETTPASNSNRDALIKENLSNVSHYANDLVPSGDEDHQRAGVLR